MKTTINLLAALALLTTAATAATVTLEWDESPAPDLSHYTVYRATANDATTPTLETFDAIGTTTLTTLTDAEVPAKNLFYTVTATDTSGNESEPCKPILLDLQAPPTPTNLRVKVTVTVEVQ